jgi:multidrug resistance efflux pump
MNKQGGGQTGSSTIISILPEGTPVKAGEIVCELDKSAFVDAAQAQRIRYLQAKASVEQARAMLEVSELSLAEYRDGILPQDKQLVRRYIETCQLDKLKAEDTVAWSRKVVQKGFRTQAQLQADIQAGTRARLALDEAEGMLERLEKFTGPRLLKELQAKIEAVRTDYLAQQASFLLESERLKKLETMIEYCTLRAPRDGIVAYCYVQGRRSSTENQIDEGVTVRQGQAIFSIPNSARMEVKVRVNETKFPLIRLGQRAAVRVDAFPDQELSGTVTEVTAMPVPSDRNSGDIRIYLITVKIDKGIDGLRPGLSAAVDVHVGTARQVTRVPVGSLHWVGGRPYVAIVTSSPEGKARWEWKKVDVGLSNEQYAEIVSGLEPGERVAAQPGLLPISPSRREFLADVHPPKTADGTAVANAEPNPKPH